jgi:hypothetical protein
MGKVFATPKEGVLVRHENGKQLESTGESVDRNSYWLRRERDGDVTLTADVPETAVEAISAPADTAKKTKA